MSDNILSRLREATLKLKVLLHRADEAAAGRGNFTPEDLREAQGPISSVTPVLGDAMRLRASVLEIDCELQNYSKNLETTQAALDRVRVVLLARCASMEAQRAHLATVRMWSSAWADTQANSNISESSLPLESATYEQSSSGF